MKFRDEFADINWWPLGNLKQWRLRTHTQTNKSICHFATLSPPQISKSKHVKIFGRFEASPVGGSEWPTWVGESGGLGWLQLLLVLLHYMYAQLYIYKTTCIYDYHIYLYIYIYIHTCIWLESESVHNMYVGFWVRPDSDRHDVGPTDLSDIPGVLSCPEVVAADWGARALSFSMIFLGLKWCHHPMV